MSTQVHSTESIPTLGQATYFADLDFDDFAGRGLICPQLTVTFKARASVHPDSARQHVVRPLRMVARLYRGNQAQNDGLLAVGDADFPLNQWQHSYSTDLVLSFSLGQQAIGWLVDAVSNPYPPVLAQVSGLVEIVTPTRPTTVQVQPVNVQISRSAIDWSTKVLEQIGWRKYAFFAFPIPDLPQGADLVAAVGELEQVNARYLVGDDAGVFAAAYKAIEPFYAKRSVIAGSFANGAKGAAVQQLIEEAHRFSNGVRHASVPNRSTESFTVEHRDAEFMRLLVFSLVTYLAKQSRS